MCTSACALPRLGSVVKSDHEEEQEREHRSARDARQVRALRRRWLSPRDFLRVFVDQGAPGSTARHLCCTQLLSLPFSLRFALSRSRPHMTASRSLSAVSPASAPHRA